jgi:hypothetical protein
MFDLMIGASEMRLHPVSERFQAGPGNNGKQR